MIKEFFVWDLGATKCSAGLIEYNVQTKELKCKKNCSLKLTNATSLEDLVQQLESSLNYSMQAADGICIGAAGHYDGACLILEGIYPYPMPFAAVAKKLNWRQYAVIHDYAPIVCATFTDYMNDPHNVLRLNDSPINHAGRRIAFGIGTGLGGKDGVLFSNGQFWLGENEIGHIGITHPPHAEAEFVARHNELIRFLQTEDPNIPITFEKILSGPGLARLHKFFYATHGSLSPEEVGEKMLTQEVPEVSRAFSWYLGLFVGTLQLLFMPEGGVWITGGVAIKHLHAFDHPDFFKGIHASPAYLTQRKAFALGVLCNQEHALIGSGYYLSKNVIHSNCEQYST